MNEDQAREALTVLKVFYAPNVDSRWVDTHLQHIRSHGDGYWVTPYAAEYLKKLESRIILG